MHFYYFLAHLNPWNNYQILLIKFLNFVEICESTVILISNKKHKLFYRLLLCIFFKNINAMIVILYFILVFIIINIKHIHKS